MTEAEGVRPPEAENPGGKPPESGPRWADQFFAALRQEGTVVKAAALIGKHRSTVYEWFEKAPEFRQACMRILAGGGDAVLETARRLAIEGSLEPVVQGGQVALIRRKFYPSLLKHFLGSSGGKRRGKGRPRPAAPDPIEIAEATYDVLKKMTSTVPPASPAVPPTPPDPKSPGGEAT